MERAAEKMGREKIAAMFTAISGTYDFLNRMLSLGIDRRWRRLLQQRIVQAAGHRSGLSILDLATGTGDLGFCLIELAQVGQVIGIDISKGMLEQANKKRTKLAGALQSKIFFKEGDSAQLEFLAESFDMVTVAFGIRNFSKLEQALLEARRVLRPGGQLMILEFGLPRNRLMCALYLIYFRHILPRLGSLFSGNGAAYRYLNQTVENFPFGDAMLSLLKTVGFSSPRATALTGGVAYLYQCEKI